MERKLLLQKGTGGGWPDLVQESQDASAPWKSCWESQGLTLSALGLPLCPTGATATLSSESLVQEVEESREVEGSICSRACVFVAPGQQEHIAGGAQAHCTALSRVPSLPEPL